MQEKAESRNLLLCVLVSEKCLVLDGQCGSRFDDFCRFPILKASGNSDLSYSPSQQMARPCFKESDAGAERRSPCQGQRRGWRRRGRGGVSAQADAGLLSSGSGSQRPVPWHLSQLTQMTPVESEYGPFACFLKNNHLGLHEVCRIQTAISK